MCRKVQLEGSNRWKEMVSKRKAAQVLEDQSEKCSSCDPAAPASNGRSGRLKACPEFQQSLNAAKVICSCHNNQLGDRHLKLLMKKIISKKQRGEKEQGLVYYVGNKQPM